MEVCPPPRQTVSPAGCQEQASIFQSCSPQSYRPYHNRTGRGEPRAPRRLPGSLLLTGFHQFDKLGDALRAHLGAAPGGVDPAEVLLAIEGGQSIEEPCGLRIGFERRYDVRSESFALRALGHEHHADRIPRVQTSVAPVS